MNKPKFLVIGVQKAATSWLWVMLQKHSQIWFPPGKELHFFDHLYVNENRKWTRGHKAKYHAYIEVADESWQSGPRLFEILNSFSR